MASVTAAVLILISNLQRILRKQLKKNLNKDKEISRLIFIDFTRTTDLSRQ